MRYYAYSTYIRRTVKFNNSFLHYLIFLHWGHNMTNKLWDQNRAPLSPCYDQHLGGPMAHGLTRRGRDPRSPHNSSTASPLLIYLPPYLNLKAICPAIISTLHLTFHLSVSLDFNLEQPFISSFDYPFFNFNHY